MLACSDLALVAATRSQVTTTATTERAGDMVLLLHWAQLRYLDISEQCQFRVDT